MLIENKTTELKRGYVESIKNTVIAFANCDGGTIIIGVNDDGTVCGVEDVDDTMLRVTNVIRDAVRPDVTLFTECQNEMRDGKSVVIVTVQRGTARPYYLASKGIRPEGVYVRQGASTVPATESAIFNMIRETSGDSYESARSLNQQLTFEKTAAVFHERGVEFGLAQMRTLHLIGEDGTYTNLALLLSEQCTHSIKFAVFEGSKKTVFKDRREMSGSLLDQIEVAYQYIDQYNRTRAEFVGLNRVDIRDYPTEAVREALLNSIVHRDYSFSGPTLISLFDDRLEFLTLGGLVKGISLNDIKLGVSVLRNNNLANIFYRLKFIEAYGTGIMKINECYDGHTIQPVIEVADNVFKITLPNINYCSDESDQIDDVDMASRTYPSKEERELAVISLCREQGSVTRREVQEVVGVSQPTAILLLRQLVDNGTLIKEGNGRKLRYRLK